MKDNKNLVPVYKELPADLETPVSVFLKLARTPNCFLLESVERGEQLGRYSFIGTSPYLVLRTSGNEGTVSHDNEVTKVELGISKKYRDPLSLLKSIIAQQGITDVSGLPPFFGGAVGYLAYDVVRFFEKLPDCQDDELHLPDSIFIFSDPLIIFDHVQHKMKIISNVPGGSGNKAAHQKALEKIDAVIANLNSSKNAGFHSRPGAEIENTPPLTSNFTSAQFVDIVNTAKEYILKGDAFQIVLSQRLRRKTAADPFLIYRALRMINPSPYMFYLNFGDFQLMGSSPEMLVKLEEGQVETRPIAGTKRRGKNQNEDKAIIASLLNDNKEKAEHTMLVDLGRNDIGRVSRYGSVKVPQFMGIEKYSHVVHIVSSVISELKEGYDAFDLLRACFPAGTVSGAPKVRSMEIIAELEGTKRGPYAGAVGYFDFRGNMDTCITIRTIAMVGDTVYFQGGAGIVADSDPIREYEETLNKIQVMEDAVRLAESWKAGTR